MGVTRRQVSVVGVAMAAVAVMVGSSTSLAQSPAAPLAGHITMWDIAESDSYVAWWQQHIQDFQAANPGVTIDLQQFPSEDYKTKIQSAVVAGTAPDIFYAIPGPRYAEAARQGKVAALDGAIDAGTITTAARDACTVDGSLVCVPLYVAPSYIYYNTALFDKAGVDPSKWADPTQPTWDEFNAACQQLKTAGVAPIGVGNGDQWPGLFFDWALQNRIGGVAPFQDAMDGTNGGSFASDSFVRAGTMTQQLAKDCFQPGFNGVGGDQKYSLFTQGNAAMIFMGPWMIDTIASTAPEGFAYGVFAFPSLSDGDAESQTDVMAGIDALWRSSTSTAPDVADAFLASFTDPTVQQDFVNTTQSIPAYSGIVPGDDPDSSIAKVAALASSAAHAFPWWDSALAPEVANVMLNNSQALLAGDMTPEAFGQAMDKAAGR